MANQNVALLAFNRGLISARALGRIDLPRLGLSADIYTNWMARKLGSMMLRPGLAHIGSTASNNKPRYIPFVFATNDTALIELTDVLMRVWVNDALVTRPSVSTAVTNGTFTSNLTGWTDSDEAGASSTWVTGGYMGLTGDGTNHAIREQTLTVAGGDQNVEHALRIVIARGPAILRVGSTVSGDEYIAETYLEEGIHSLAFTPTGASVYVQLKSSLKRIVLIDSVTIEAAGVMTITSPWPESELQSITHDQSGDVVYCARAGYQQRKIERRASTSWSLVKYQVEDGPFRADNFSPITITPSGLSGNISLVASDPIWTSGNVGGIYRITSSGQTVSSTISAENTFTNTILVTGVDSQRIYQITISSLTGTGSTVTLQRSFDSDVGPWEDVATYTTDTGPVSYDDALDNQIIWYRIGIKTGDYAGGSITAELAYAVGSIDGIVRITAYTSAVSVEAEVLYELGDTEATDLWAEGRWSDRRGWPGAVRLHEGRLWWAGKDGVFGSVSDGYQSYDPLVEGDSGPIVRNVGSGPVDVVNWLLALQRLIIGAEGIEYSAKSNSLDEPLTPTNISIKPSSTYGSAAVPAEKIDKSGVYVQLGGTRIMEVVFSTEDYEYGSKNMTELVPELFGFGENVRNCVSLGVQRRPDTRIHCVKADGTVGVAVFDPAENVLCWLQVETTGASGFVEDVVVLPAQTGDDEDQVYYAVRRTVDGNTVRYLEKWAHEHECIGAAVTTLADSHVRYDGIAASTTLTGLSHLEGEEVTVWGNGKDLGTATVSGGQITGLSEAVTDACVGLAYTGQWRSAKLATVAQMGTGLTMPKRIPALGVVLAYAHYQGLRYGRDFNNLRDLPQVVNGKLQAADTIYTAADMRSFGFDGAWDSDARVCLQAASPRPCMVLALTVDLDVNEPH